MRTDRLNEMEQYVLKHASASLEELAQVFGISLNTVRRDVQTLLQRGLIRKVYGGVAAVNQAEPLPMSVRAGRNSEEKQIIGKLAGTLIGDHTSVFLDSGSTTPQILPYLAEKQSITVVTHSLAAMYEASRYPNLKVINLGGVFNADTASYVGITTVEALARIRVDTVLIAATGVSLEHGLTNTTYLEADIKRRVTEHAANIVLMADHSKFDHTAVLSFCPFHRLSAVVTDRPPANHYLDYMAEHEIRLLHPEQA